MKDHRMSLGEEQANARVRERLVNARNRRQPYAPSEADRDKLRTLVQTKQVSKKTVCKLLGCDYKELKDILR